MYVQVCAIHSAKNSKQFGNEQDKVRHSDLIVTGVWLYIGIQQRSGYQDKDDAHSGIQTNQKPRASSPKIVKTSTKITT